MGVGNVRNAAIYAARILGAMPLAPPVVVDEEPRT
jgi:hypothetical protein